MDTEIVMELAVAAEGEPGEVYSPERKHRLNPISRSVRLLSCRARCRPVWTGAEELQDWRSDGLPSASLWDVYHAHRICTTITRIGITQVVLEARE